jgi:TonB family protein
MDRLSTRSLATIRVATRLFAAGCAAGSLTMLGSAWAADTAPLVLQPSSPWAISFSKDACHLARSFGEGDDSIAIDLRQYGPGRLITVLALGKSLRYLSSRTPLVSEFGPNGTRHENKFPLMIKQEDGRGLVETWAPLVPKPGDDEVAKSRPWQPDPDDLDPNPYDREAEGRVTELRLSGPIRREVVLQLGRMDLPMDQMRICLDDLMQRWGVDPEAYHSLSRHAVPSSNPGTWALISDYPQRMLENGMSGTVHFRLMVDKNGMHTECSVKTAGGSDFDKLTCQIMMRRARFTPALDAAGQPVASFYINSVRWVA